MSKNPKALLEFKKARKSALRRNRHCAPVQAKRNMVAAEVLQNFHRILSPYTSVQQFTSLILFMNTKLLQAFDHLTYLGRFPKRCQQPYSKSLPRSKKYDIKLASENTCTCNMVSHQKNTGDKVKRCSNNMTISSCTTISLLAFL